VAVFFLLGTLMSGLGAQSGRVSLQGHVPSAVAGLTAKGRLPATNQLSLAIGLPLRNEAELDELLRQLYDPASTNFHKFLTPVEFTARFGPTEADYAAVRQFAESNGFTVTGTHGNRLVLDVQAGAASVERAFQVSLKTFRHPTENRDFFSPDVEPSVPTNLPVADMWGLSDFGRPHPNLIKRDLANVAPQNGSAPSGSGAYFGNDFRNAYVPGTTLTGAGQMVGLLQFDGFYSSDIAAYAAAAGNGRTNIAIQTVLLDGFNGVPTTGAKSGNGEVSLDIEMAMSMAPGLTKIIVFEGNPATGSFFPNDVLNAMAASNTVKNLSSSWGWSGGPSTTTDSIFQTMAAQGQSFFNASGDSDAFTSGSKSVNRVDSSANATTPASSPYITQVGGTTLTTGASAAYTSETVWNWNYDANAGKYVGSSGGISSHYSMPSWQTNVSNMTSRGGSSSHRNIPDVALTADNVYVEYGNGSSAVFGGTSCAAPLWAGFCALVNQQSFAAGGTNVGFLNPTLYTIAASTNYNSCFHDITTGSNTWPSSLSLFYATTGYDLCTGLGTPNGTNLINVLAPEPGILTQPADQNTASGFTTSLSVSAVGSPPLNFQWQLNGTNLPGGTDSTLSFSPVQTNDSGNYTVIITNSYGAITSSVAVLNVGFAPAISLPSTNLTALVGSNVVFSATVTGSTNLVYQWQKNGTNLANGTGISGATSNLLTLTAVTTNASGAYSLKVTNIFGSVTSSVANLLVVVPPAITSASLADRTVECGDNTNTFSVTATGTAPLAIQWSLDGVAIPGATNTSLSLTNVSQPSHTVSVTVTNLYASATSNAFLTVTDTLPPVITLLGSSWMTNELGSAFTDPGAIVTDTCAGTNVTLLVSGAVNTSVTGTYPLTYLATDTSGNASTNTRIVVVRDTTPPVILQSFTNLVLAADTNCSAVMPDVTGTNFISATDVSGAVTLSQDPTNTAILLLGTNVVVITVADASGNTAYSTNQIIVQDQTPPQILSEPQSQTNLLGETVTFTATATACTPVAFQWYFNAVALPAQTNNSLTCSDLTLAAAGNYFVTATADGGSSTSAVATLSVTLQPSAVTLATSANPSGYQDNLIFTASVVPANATGTVQFFTNGTAFDLEPLVAGFAVSTNLATLLRGTNLIAAAYSGDADFSPATNTLAQIVTNHPPVADEIYFSRAAGSLLSIAITNLASYWSDADGDTVSLAAVGASTNGVVLTNFAGTLVYSNFNNVADQFICTLTDGWGGTNFQTVYISILLPSIANVATSPSGGLKLQLAGASGLTYVLESTTSLFPANWQPVATNTLNGSGQWIYNPLVTNTPNCFYRLKLVQP